jgi:type I restriction enzyme S subunit
VRKGTAVESDPKQGVLTNLIEVYYGKNHKRLADGIYPVYGSGGLIRHVEKYLHEGESVLIPRKDNLNNVMLVDGRFWIVDTMFYTRKLMEGAARYAYFILTKMNLASMNTGSAVPSMTTKILAAIPVVLPSETILAKLKSWSDPLFEQIRLNEQENKRLSSLLDALLPKLMSGEIDVSRIELPTPPNNHLCAY